jgi:hypothetical protein
MHVAYADGTEQSFPATACNFRAWDGKISVELSARILQGAVEKVGLGGDGWVSLCWEYSFAVTEPTEVCVSLALTLTEPILCRDTSLTRALLGLQPAPDGVVLGNDQNHVVLRGDASSRSSYFDYQAQVRYPEIVGGIAFLSQKPVGTDCGIVEVEEFTQVEDVPNIAHNGIEYRVQDGCIVIGNQRYAMPSCAQDYRVYEGGFVACTPFGLIDQSGAVAQIDLDGCLDWNVVKKDQGALICVIKDGYVTCYSMDGGTPLSVETEMTKIAALNSRYILLTNGEYVAMIVTMDGEIVSHRLLQDVIMPHRSYRLCGQFLLCHEQGYVIRLKLDDNNAVARAIIGATVSDASLDLLVGAQGETVTLTRISSGESMVMSADVGAVKRIALSADVIYIEGERGIARASATAFVCVPQGNAVEVCVPTVTVTQALCEEENL